MNQDAPQGVSNAPQKKFEGMLTDWMNMGVILVFRLKGGTTIEGKLVYYSGSEYEVQLEGKESAIVIRKDVIESVERK